MDFASNQPVFGAIVVAAGRGTRFGGEKPKQFLPFCGKTVLEHALAPFLAEPAIGPIVVVVNGDDVVFVEALLAPYAWAISLAIGGATRQDLVRAGLAALANQAPDQVLIHDGARPLLTSDALARLLATADPATCATLSLPVSDTLVRQAVGGAAIAVSRDNLHAVQTPQMFPYQALVAAHEQRTKFAAAYTDDTTLMQDAGMPVVLVPGDPDNLKITHSGDIERAERLVAARQGGMTAEPATGIPLDLIDVRVGQGYDIHVLEPGDGVWLCGVKVPHDKRLAGHSDADVALHALTDALLATIGAGDIGDHFPPSDMQWKGASSDIFLRHAGRLVQELGGRITLCDVTLVAEAPKIGPYRQQMRNKIANILDIDVCRVSVKATTNEKIGSIGRREGICALASASVVF